MARKRLALPFGDAPAQEPKAMPSAPPISRVVGESAAAAALESLAGEVATARAEGRIVEALPLAAVDAAHLVRDRVGFDEEEFAALVESLCAHGQRAPIEVVDLGEGRPEGRYGLISGWRRLSALRRLHEETGEARVARVLALLRPPRASGDAYVAMVEENEIRAGLSYYERARIAAKAVEAGAFPERQVALRALYATASRAKRSKIGAFLVIHDQLGEVLRFPSAIPERLGLVLSARLAEPGFSHSVAARLTAVAPRNAAAEMELLSRLAVPASAPREERPRDAAGGGAAVRLAPLPEGGLVLTGPGVDGAFRKRLEAWLRKGQA